MKSLTEYIQCSYKNENDNIIDVEYKLNLNYTFEDFCKANGITDPRKFHYDTYELSRFKSGFFPLKHYPTYQEKIYETLFNVGNVYKLFNEIVKNFGKYVIDNRFEKSNNYLKHHSLFIKFTKNFDENNKFQSLLNLYNYYISQIDENDQQKIIYINAKYDEEVSEYIKEKCGNKLYHITTNEKLNNILKYGLIPKGTIPDNTNKHSLTNYIKSFVNRSNKTKHPERIYFLDVHTNEEIIDVFKKNLILDRNNKNLHPVLLEIDLNKLRNKINIYRDPDSGPFCFWTGEPISPFAIKEKTKYSLYNHLERWINEIKKIILNKE